MRDYLVELANDKLTAQIVKTLGLPTPARLRRGPADAAEPLQGRTILCAGLPGGHAARQAAAALKALGAEVLGELPADDSRLAGVVLDASACRDAAALRGLYDFFQPLLRRLLPCARIVVLAGAPEEQADPVTAAAARGIQGFVRALAKEAGKRGATANALVVSRAALDRLRAPLRFFCSDASAYVSGQPLSVSANVAPPARQPATQRLAGKVALVTGAARGIGAATASRLARAGAKVICLDVAAAREPLYELALRLGGTPLVLDVTQAPGELADFIESKFGGLDILVHNAGITRDKTLANMKPEQWDQVLAVNFDAIVSADRELDARGLLRDGGREVCLSSVSGVAGNYGQTNYALTKAALIGYVAARAPALAARGITVNAVAPGFIETPMALAMPALTREMARRLNSLTQGGQPEDVAEAIGFLAEPDAHGVSGQTLRVCGQALIGA